jgi:hypothetical protein
MFFLTVLPFMLSFSLAGSICTITKLMWVNQIVLHLISLLYSLWKQRWSCSDHTSQIKTIILLTYLLMELRPSWEAANCAATQDLPSVLWNLKVQYRPHKSPPLVPILSQIDPIPTIPSYLSKIHFNIVHPPTLKITISYINYILNWHKHKMLKLKSLQRGTQEKKPWNIF